MTLDRRTLLAVPVLAAGALPAAAEAQQLRVADPFPLWPPAERFALWPGLPPGAPAVLPRPAPEITGKPGEYHDVFMRGVAAPEVGVFRARRPDGRGMLILPGGGYAFTSLRGEGIDVARLLADSGITCFVLSYRLPGEGWANRADVPLADAQRAMRLIRAEARRYGVDPARLGALGFSAGGHLCASLAVHHGLDVYRPADAADRQTARPAWAGLIYPVISLEPGRSFGVSRNNLLGPGADRAGERRYSLDRHVAATTPPLFLAHAEDDPVVPAANSLAMFAAARARRVEAEVHVFQRGGHGFGVRPPASLPASLWPDLFTRWLAGLSRTAG